MSKTVKELIISFDAAVANSPFPVNMTAGDRFLAAATQGDNVVIWYEINPFAPRPGSRLLHVVQSGKHLPDHATHFASVQLTTYDQRHLVVHLFDGGDPMAPPVAVSDGERRGREWAERHGKRPVASGDCWYWRSWVANTATDEHTVPTLLAVYLPTDVGFSSESTAYEALGKAVSEMTAEAQRLTQSG